MNIRRDLLKYSEDIRNVLKDIKDIIINNSNTNKDKVIEALSLANFYINELLILKTYLSDFTNMTPEDIVSSKKQLKCIEEFINTFRLLITSLTAILRSITLSERYKLEISNLEVVLENDFGILYFDKLQDCSYILHKRSGYLERFQKPYLTRRENKALAEKLFTKLKNVENTR